MPNSPLFWSSRHPNGPKDPEQSRPVWGGEQRCLNGVQDFVLPVQQMGDANTKSEESVEVASASQRRFDALFERELIGGARMTNRFTLARALRGEAVKRPPVWMMRQAGRYLPEYMELRAKYPFLERCYNPEIAAEITLQPLRRFDFDAEISSLTFFCHCTKWGPTCIIVRVWVHKLTIRCAALQRSMHSSPLIHGAILDSPMKAIQLCKQETDVPILGFAGSIYHGLLSGRGRRL